MTDNLALFSSLSFRSFPFSFNFTESQASCSSRLNFAHHCCLCFLLLYITIPFNVLRGKREVKAHDGFLATVIKQELMFNYQFRSYFSANYLFIRPRRLSVSIADGRMDKYCIQATLFICTCAFFQIALTAD